MSNQISRLSWLQLAALSAPALVFGGLEIPLRVFMPVFLSEHVGLSLGTVGTLFLLVRLWDMVSDPLIGTLGDAVETPIGRRRPWILLGIPLAIASTVALYFAEPGMSALAVGLWLIVLYTGWTLIIVPHGAWGVEITDSYHERSRIFGVKMIVAALSFPIFIFGPALLEQRYGAVLADQVAFIGWVLIATLLLTVAFLFLVVPDIRLPRSKLNFRTLLDGFTVVFTRRRFAAVSFVYFCVALADAVAGATFLFFVRDALGFPTWVATGLIVQAMIGVFGLMLWLWASGRLGKVLTLQIVVAGNLILGLAPLFLPAENLAFLLAYLVAKGILWGTDYALLRAIVADLVEEDSQDQGAARAGTFYASFNLTTKLAGAVGVAIALWILASVGFQPQTGEPPSEQTITMVRYLTGLPFIVCGLASLLVLSRLRDNGFVSREPSGAAAV